MLQVSGIEYSYDASRPAGQRITSATVNGSPLDRGATYTVAANSFLATGGDGFTTFEEGQNPPRVAHGSDPRDQAAALSQSSTTLPDLPDFIASKPSR